MFFRPARLLRISLAALVVCLPAATHLHAQQDPSLNRPPAAVAPANLSAAAAPSEIPASIPSPPPPASAPAHQIDPEATPTLELADALTARGRYLAAIHVYEKLAPTTANIQNRMGVASERMLMFDQAERCFQAAIKLDPSLAEAWNNLGTVLHSRGDLGKAEKMYRKSIKLKPTNADTFQNLGALLYSKRNYTKGDAMYREAMRIDPAVMERTAQRGIQAGGSKNNAEMHFHLACTFARGGNNALAIDYLRRSILEGFHDRNRILRETSFADLRTSESFLKLVDDMKNN